MLRICPGYASSAVCGPVARAGALRRPREKSAEWQNFPEAMLRICPDYASSAVCGPVARAGALRPPPGRKARNGRYSRRRCCVSVRATRPQQSAGL
nr:hypothetical protein F0332_19105 [Klebsiella grimontii]